ncbi:unnamed protein product [Pleuronectes platessa]|uniref:Uncharacterized protein n=1 Tax=Pleuronectes platessa TaxID=8262 RepID=A0A9N7YIU4_PLEPL|nr:unnamed protein product [Pleuronectes platessa]
MNVQSKFEIGEEEPVAPRILQYPELNIDSSRRVDPLGWMWSVSDSNVNGPDVTRMHQRTRRHIKYWKPKIQPSFSLHHLIWIRNLN